MLYLKSFAYFEHPFKADSFAILSDREYIPLRDSQLERVLLDARCAQLALQCDGPETVLHSECPEFILDAPLINQFVECTGSIVLVFVVVAGNMEPVFIDAYRMRRSVHLGGDVILKSCECLYEIRLCLHSRLVSMRYVIRKSSYNSSSCSDLLFDLPLFHAEYL